MTPPHKWRTVQIPSSLYDQVLEVVNNPRAGYTGVSDFVRESIRKRLEDFSKLGDDHHIHLPHALNEDLRSLHKEKGDGNFQEFIRGILQNSIPREKKS